MRRNTHYAAAGSQLDNWSNPQSHTLYARNNARHDDSITLVRRTTKPIKVRKMKAVRATPRSVEERGEDAAAGYD